jgi:hypothetical protein
MIFTVPKRGDGGPLGRKLITLFDVPRRVVGLPLRRQISARPSK